MQYRNLIVVSDLHCGCRLGLTPPGVRRIPLDDGGFYEPSLVQKKIARMWREFWEEWVPSVTRGEPYALVVNGDALDGVHHNAVTQISHNLADQARIARMVLEPVVEKAAVYYHIRGTEAHVGPSAQEEERLAESLGANPNAEGQYARYDLWIEVGGRLVHLMHHIGTSGSQAYEATAVHKELVEEYAEAGRWGLRAPCFIVRSHRHRFLATVISNHKGRATAIITPGFQAKTPFTWKITGARSSQPQFGGIIIRAGEEEVYYREQIWSVDRSRTE